LIIKPTTYSDAGVDIDAATRATDKIRELARRTFNDRTLSEIGSFGGMFDGAFPSLAQPVLVASADGVGTKLKIAFATGINNTVGRDLVNHCVNDILVQGARPLFFLDYIATGKLSPETVASIVEGIANGCRANDCVLLGGETAEMPGFYADGEYDIAGFIVGAVERSRIINGRDVAPGDALIGLPSSGLHTNGYSLARRVFFEMCGLRPNDVVDELGCSAGDALLATHRSYLPIVRPLLAAGLVKGMAHITGGGLPGNLNRALPAGLDAVVDESSWEIPNVFRQLERAGQVDRDEMFRAFNMGVGAVAIVAPGHADEVMAAAGAAGVRAWRLGAVVPGGGVVRFSGRSA